MPPILMILCYLNLPMQPVRPFLIKMHLTNFLKEPMIILLFVASSIYFISGNLGDGIFLVAAIVLVGSISLYQDSRSRKALEKLKSLTQPNCTVIRNGEVVGIPSEEVVLGDSLMIEEGTLIPADGTIIHSNDFSVNESILTGESFSVFKDVEKTDKTVFSGTTVASGLAIATVTAIGNKTVLGKIGKSLESIKEETPTLAAITTLTSGIFEAILTTRPA